MFHRLSKLAVVAALACSIGLHWELLQSAAWFGMVVHYSQKAPFAVALLKTFDGKHPCALCKVVTKGRSAEKQGERPAASKKFEFSYIPANFFFRSPQEFSELTAWGSLLEGILQSPALPPPKPILG